MGALFIAVSLPETVLVVDRETLGGTVLVRRPSRGELADLKRAAAADDEAAVLTRSYGLAGLEIRQVEILGPRARAVLDDAIAERIAEARAASVN